MSDKEQEESGLLADQAGKIQDPQVQQEQNQKQDKEQDTLTPDSKVQDRPINNSENQQQQQNQDNLNEESQKATPFQAQINLFKGLVGLGVIALPVGFSQAGWVVGIVLIPIVGYVMYYCATLMLDLADSKGLNPRNIIEFSEVMFAQPGVEGSGKTVGTIVTFFLFCLQLGVCIGYTIFFMNYFQASFCHFDWETGCNDRIYAVLFALLIVIPLGLIRNIKNLKIPSNIGNIILLISLFVMMFDCYQQISENGMKLEKAVDFWGLSSYVGIVVFTLEGVGLFFDIRHSMEDPKLFKPALLNVVHLAIFMYATVGFVGYMAFGDKVQDLLLFNLPMDNDFYYSVQILYSLVLCLSFPLQLFPVANFIEIQMKNALFGNNNISQNPDEQSQQIQIENNDQQQQQPETQQDENGERQLTKEEEKSLTYYSYGMRIALTLGIFSFAMTLTKVSVFLNLAGSIGGIALLYLIPVVIYNMNAENVSQRKIILNWVISGIGLFAGLCGIYTSMVEIFADMNNGLDLFFL